MGRQVRIAGLVRAADMVRRELSAPLSADRRERLRERVETNLVTVQQILRDEGSALTDMPAPSQRAYLFLAGLDWNKLGMSSTAADLIGGKSTGAAAVDQASSSGSGLDGAAAGSQSRATGGAPNPTNPASSPGQIVWTGLGKVIDRAVDALADEVSEEVLQCIGASVARASREMELTIKRRSFTPEQLSPETRVRRGWLAFFSQLENLTTYVGARMCAGRLLDAAAVGSKHYPPPLTIHFRPIRGIYKLRSVRGGVFLWLPTPMIVFDAAGFAALASLIYERGAGARQHVLGLMTSHAYQTVRAEIESLGGIVEQSRGANHDLGASFDRVNAGYFGGKMVRPHLTWNRTFTGRKFGHYDWINDTLMVSRTLDSPQAPEYVVDFLVFHELLHKYHGLHWVNGRGYAHTSEFQRDERKFAQYEQAEAMLQKLATSVR